MSDQSWNPNQPPQQPAGDPYATTNRSQFSQDPNPYGQPPQSAPSASDPTGQNAYAQQQPDPYAQYQQGYGQQPAGQYQQQPDPYAYQQYGQATAQAKAPAGDNFFGALFDFTFTKYVTPSVVKVLYILVIVMIGLAWLLQTYTAWQLGAEFGIITFVLGAVFALGGIALARVGLETSVALIRVAQHTEKIKDKVLES